MVSKANTVASLDAQVAVAESSRLAPSVRKLLASNATSAPLATPVAVLKIPVGAVTITLSTVTGAGVGAGVVTGAFFLLQADTANIIINRAT